MGLEDHSTKGKKGKSKTIKKLLDPLKEAGYHLGVYYAIEDKTSKTSLKKSKALLNKTICLTGKFKLYPSRFELIKKLSQLGATVLFYPSRKIDYLICGEKFSSTKMVIAFKMRAKIVYEVDIQELHPDLAP